MQAFAQGRGGGGANRQDARSDLSARQEDAIDATSATLEQNAAASQAIPPKPREFNVRITAPLYFNSDARQRGYNASPALEGDPEVELGWSRTLSAVPLKVSVKLRADTERYARVPQANEDEASATFRAQYYDAKDDQALAPYVSYKGTLLFKATYSPWTQTKNDLNAGLVKLFTFDANLQPLPPSARSSAAATWSLTLTTSVQRRLRTPGADSTALIGGVDIGYVPGKDWTILLGVLNTERWYDAVTSRNRTINRRDFKAEPLLTIAWAPSAIAAFGAPVIALQIGFVQQSSTVARSSYGQWTLGPVMTANWRF